MDLSSIIAMSIGVAGTIGGYMGGRHNSSVASDTLSMLSAQIETLKSQVEQIPGLNTRIQILEDLVTQRADVEGLKEIVGRMDDKIDDIRSRVV